MEMLVVLWSNKFFQENLYLLNPTNFGSICFFGTCSHICCAPLLPTNWSYPPPADSQHSLRALSVRDVEGLHRRSHGLVEHLAGASLSNSWRARGHRNKKQRWKKSIGWTTNFFSSQVVLDKSVGLGFLNPTANRFFRLMAAGIMTRNCDAQVSTGQMVLLMGENEAWHGRSHGSKDVKTE